MSENNQTKSNGRGGARKGAGRKVGSATTKTRAIADRAASEGVTPLEFMLSVMRKEPSGDIKDERVLQSIREMRFEAAKAAAPYMHPKLSAIEHTGRDGEAIKTENKWLVELVQAHGVPPQPAQ